MAHTKAGGTTRLGRDSAGQRLGVKVGDGQTVHAGSILVRQRGTLFEPGRNVMKGRDDTLFASMDGQVKYRQIAKRGFSGSRRTKTEVSVAPVAAAAEAKPKAPAKAPSPKKKTPAKTPAAA